MKAADKATPRSRIPDFASLEEEAEFWDTRDTTGFEEEFKPVRVRVAGNLSEAVTVRLDPETVAKLRTRAKRKGIGPTTLARMWILERLEQENEESKASKQSKD